MRTDELTRLGDRAAAPESRWPRFVLPLVAAVSTALIIQWIWTGRAARLAGCRRWRCRDCWRFAFVMRAHHVAHGMEQREQELRALAMIMERIEREPCQRRAHAPLRDRVRSTGRSPADEIRRLARLIDILSSGHNQHLRADFGASASRHAAGVCGGSLAGTLRAGGAGLAGRRGRVRGALGAGDLSAEHPEHPFPELIEGAADVRGRSRGPSAACRRRPSPTTSGSAATPPHLLLVSGSNMSGKSTLLRTVGLNAVLAQAGAPGPGAAPAHDTAPHRRDASDSGLAAGRTVALLRRDHAESARSWRSPPRNLRPRCDLRPCGDLRPEPPSPRRACCFCSTSCSPDTNSHDRLEGATGILKGCSSAGAIGLATTHDLALTAMVDGLGERAVNVHFEDRFDNGMLTFDYRLKPGVVQIEQRHCVDAGGGAGCVTSGTDLAAVNSAGCRFSGLGAFSVDVLPAGRR